MTTTYNKQVLLKRGNTAVSSTYIGPVGEVTVDTDLDTIRVHDGVTPGGHLSSSSYSGTTPPGAPRENMLWYDTAGGRLYVYYDGAWVDASPAGDQELNANVAQLSRNVANVETHITSLDANIGTFENQVNSEFIDFQNLVVDDIRILDANIGTFENSVNATVDTINANINTLNETIIGFEGNAGPTSAAWTSDNPPMITNVGALWYDDVGGRLYVRYDDTWVDANPPITTGFGNVLPSADVTYSLGSEEYQWKDLWVSSNTIYVGNTPLSIIEGTLLVDGNPVSGGTADLGKFVFDSEGDSAFISTTDDAGASPNRYDIVLVPGGEGNSSIRVPSQANSLAGFPLIIEASAANSAVVINTDIGSWTFGNTGNLTLPATNKITTDLVPTVGFIVSGVEPYDDNLGNNTYRWNGYPTNFMDVVYHHGGYVLGTLFCPISDPEGTVSVVSALVGPAPWVITFSGPLGTGPYIVQSANYAPEYYNPVNIGFGSTWQFRSDGTLTVPGAITMPDETGLYSPGHNLYITAGNTTGCSVPGGDTIISSGLGYGGAANGGGNVTLRTGDRYDKVWNFDYNGTLTIPGSIISTAGPAITFDTTFNSNIAPEIHIKASTLTFIADSAYLNDIVDNTLPFNGVPAMSWNMGGEVLTWTANNEVFAYTSIFKMPYSDSANVGVIAMTGPSGGSELSWHGGSDYGRPIGQFIKSSANVSIATNAGFNWWIFGDDGNLTIPAGGNLVTSTGSLHTISLNLLKSIVASSGSWEEFQANIAAL